MNCQTAHNLIQENLENELNTADSVKLGKHLLECAACREEMNQMEQADAYFSRQPMFPPPESLVGNVMKRVNFSPREAELIRGNLNKSIHRFWYILLSLGQFIFAVSLLIAIRPEWLLPSTWAHILKRISATGWNWFFVLKTDGMRLLELIHKISFGDEIRDFLVQPSWVNLSLLFVLLILTLYLNGRLLFARKHIFKKGVK